MNTLLLKILFRSILDGSYTRACLVLLMCCLASTVLVSAVEAKSISNVKSDVEVVGTTEFGFLGVASHQIQFGKTATEFDYVQDGGQDVLFFFSRYSLEVTLFQAHNISFLYQPLDIESSVILDRDVVIDEQTFSADTPYRFGYDYDLFAEYPEHRLSLGAALQIRNATINFSSADGTLRRTQRGVGPVPLLRARGLYSFQNGWWLGAEVDGFYAPIKYINGGESDVEGTILDSSIQLGYHLHRSMDLFMNIRYLGGGAEGTSKDESDRGDGFVSNWLHAFSFTIGIKVAPPAMLTSSKN